MVVAALLLAMLGGCGATSRNTVQSGFLSDYSDLRPSKNDKRVLVYEHENPNLGHYDAFIVEPFEVLLQPESKDEDVPMEELQALADHLHDAVVKELGAEYAIVESPAPGALRIRGAFTDVSGTTPALNIHPATKLLGLGLGGAAFEIECLDSVTGERIFAAMVSRKAAKRVGSGLTKWSDAHSVMDDWAKQFRARVDEEHAEAEETPEAAAR